MAQFKNTISITATGAINTLNKLKASLDDAAGAMGRFKAASGGDIGAGFSKGIQDADAFSKKAQNVSKRIGTSSAAAKKSVDAIGLSYRDVGRIIESQIIFSALSNLTQGFRDAADAAAEFQEQIARIAAIDESNLGIDGLRQEIEDLAVELGRPLDEVGGAVFEALQNDIGTTSETFDKLRTDAQELALVTGGDLGQAVNALSSIYKTFGTEVEGVESISGQLFGTINAGRITLADLENSLGTLSPLARQSGVELKEVLDALAAITLTGTKASVAKTQLRNVFNKLIKPTKALSQVYQELGVEGFEELTNRIGEDGSRLGFIGALQTLSDTVGGNEQEVTKLFNTIRGSLGVFNLLGDEAKLFNDVSKTTAEAAGDLKEALDGIESTAAREAAKNAAELEVIFTRLGDRALDLQNAVTNAFLAITGSSEEGVVALGAITAGLGGATIAVTKFGVAAGVAFPPVIAFLAVAGAGLGALKGLELLAENMTSLAKQSRELEVERLQAFIKTLEGIRADEIKEAEDALNNVDNVLNKVAGSANETQRALLEAFSIESGNIQAVEAQLLEAFGDARTRVLKQIEDAISEIDNKILEGEKRIRGFTQDLEDVKFEFSIEGLEAGAEATARIERASGTIAKAFEQIKNVGLGDESAQIARNTAAEAVSQARAAKAAADRSKNQTRINEAQRVLESAIQTQIALEERLNNLRGDLSKKALAEQQQAFERLSAEARDQVQDVLDVRKQIADAEIQGATDEEINKLQDKLVQEVTEARNALLEAGEAEALKTFNLEGQFQDAIDQLSQGLNETQLDWTKAINGLRTALSEATDLQATVQLTAKIAELAGESGSDELNQAVQDAIDQGGLAGDQTRNAAQAVLDVYKEQKELQGQVEEQSLRTQEASERARLAFFNARNELNSGSVEANKLVDPVLQQLDRLGDLNKEELQQLITNLEAAIPAISEQTTGLFGTFTQEQKDNLTAGVKAAIEAATLTAEGLDARKLFDEANLNAAKELLDRISSEDIQDLGFEVDSEGFAAVNEALDEINLDAENAKNAVAAIGTDAAPQVVTGLNGVNTATNGLKTAANNARAAYQELLRIAQQALQTAQEAASLNASNSSNNFFGGRPQFRNAGGDSRGQDTIPTMLSPEEFVVNSQSARKFLPQLNAINAGNAPSAGGGTGDTNITIGDVNVTSTSDVPTQTARDIALALKREIRRGTS